MSRCIVCNKPFKEGDNLQAFLRCQEDPDGVWTDGYIVDAGYQERAKENNDNIKRRHVECQGSNSRSNV